MILHRHYHHAQPGHRLPAPGLWAAFSRGASGTEVFGMPLRKGQPGLPSTRALTSIGAYRQM